MEELFTLKAFSRRTNIPEEMLLLWEEQKKLVRDHVNDKNEFCYTRKQYDELMAIPPRKRLKYKEDPNDTYNNLKVDTESSKVMISGGNNEHMKVVGERLILTEESIKLHLPPHLKGKVSNELLKELKELFTMSELPRHMFEDNFLDNLGVLQKVTGTNIQRYALAVKFCTLKQSYPLRDAYAFTFPERVKGKPESNIVASANAYNNGTLVKEIDKLMLMPFYLQYAPYAHAAIKKQFELMNGVAAPDPNGKEQKVSAMVQHLAAKTLFEITSIPEEQKIVHEITDSEETLSVKKELNSYLSDMVALQKKRLDSGESITDVQVLGLDLNNNKDEDE